MTVVLRPGPDRGSGGAIVHRATGAFGELVLRRAADGHHEVISDGTFLMDTRDGRSERALVTEAVAALDGPAGSGAVSEPPTAGRGSRRPPGVHVLVAGLGVGFSVGAALASDRVARVTVVEVEPAVVEFARHWTCSRTGADLDDPRLEVVVGDLVELLATGALPSVDAVCLDVDNGPGWTLSPANASLYEEEGLSAIRGLLRPGGALAVWSAHEDLVHAERLARVVGPVATHRYPVARGEPDVVWVARLRRPRPRSR